MEIDSPHQQFDKLEKTLRLAGKGSNWFNLEEINAELQADLWELIKDENTGTVPIEHPAQHVAQPKELNVNTKHVEVISKTEEDSQILSINNLPPLEATNLDSLKVRLRGCDCCRLCEQRSMIVFGQGNQKADLVFIGEAPGGDEDRTGIAFVGKAGKLLTQIIHSIGINRKAVYICNIIKCRPPGNRNPASDEIASCSPFLFKQLELIQPKLIVTLGNIATKTLIPNAMGIMKMRGNLTYFEDIPVIPTFHPSYLLRNQSALKSVWNDMRHIRQFLFK